jgi:hypothetical protein
MHRAGGGRGHEQKNDIVLSCLVLCELIVFQKATSFDVVMLRRLDSRLIRDERDIV